MVDETISIAKVGYKIATGDIGEDEAIDIMVDKATVRAIAVSDTLVEIGVDVAINKLGTAIAVAYPPAIPVVQTLRMFSPVIKEKMKPLVKSGIKELNRVAKPIMKSLVGAVKETVKTAVSNTIRKITILPFLR